MAPFPWQAVRNRLPTLDNLATRGVLNGSGMLCLAYKKVVELVSHLFFECEIFFEIWQLLLQWEGFKAALHNNSKDHFE